ncbi:hypothetical protein [Alkalitalea saponilacus]|uniref:Uncharacterized protein n=1 Tax=Alkalitalea saponilacus TaxID=889453 RepID=A0A1T5H4K9_9BACT|nr:hypothetical protein [Alkalitalea saponilacus]ASB50890.1 hypothetical protein CDL62_17910 [Alkalitalea saponilacus]SKC15617.1 hypothetical protein SAMN03080601_02082 [Alkalitalea saponilacus]
MEKLVPYVNLGYENDNSGNLNEFILNVSAMLPDDSKTKISGDGKISDDKHYRPITIDYNGGSKELKEFDFKIKIKRKDIGLLERGIKVELAEAGAKDHGKKGVIIDYGWP